MALAGIIVGSTAGFLSVFATWLFAGLSFGTAVFVFYAAAFGASSLFGLAAYLRCKATSDLQPRDQRIVA